MGVSSATVHTLLEAVATLLALMVGILGLIRYRTGNLTTVFFIGMTFLGTGFLDGFHTVVTSVAVKDYLPSGLPSLIPWSWIAWRREQRLEPAGGTPEVLVYSFVILLTLISHLFFAFTPLPRVCYPELFFHRPEEFVSALFFPDGAGGLFAQRPLEARSSRTLAGDIPDRGFPRPGHIHVALRQAVRHHSSTLPTAARW